MQTFIKHMWKANTLKRHRYTRKVRTRPYTKLCNRLYKRFSSKSAVQFI